MKRFLLAGVAIATVFSGWAMAADMRGQPVYKAPPPPPPPVYFSWSGCYVGGHVGYRWVEAEAAFPSVPPDFPPNIARALGYDLDSWVGGGQVGCNAQFDRWVIGIEGDFSFGEKSETREFDTVGLDNPITLTSNWNASLRGRLGWAWDRTLVYATGGAAWMRLGVQTIDFDAGVFVPEASLSARQTLVGWTVGAGIEHAFTPNWTARIEYLYADYGRERFFHGITTAEFFPTDVEVHTHTVRVGVNYRFGLGKYPVSAKY
jgi:outer membrane immunogenic protein